jgi:hypothetical protein
MKPWINLQCPIPLPIRFCRPFCEHMRMNVRRARGGSLSMDQKLTGDTNRRAHSVRLHCCRSGVSISFWILLLFIYPVILRDIMHLLEMVKVQYWSSRRLHCRSKSCTRELQKTSCDTSECCHVNFMTCVQGTPLVQEIQHSRHPSRKARMELVTKKNTSTHTTCTVLL